MNSAAGRIALARSSSDELEIELAKVIQMPERQGIEQHRRFVNLGISIDKGALRLSIRGSEPRAWGANVWPKGTGLRVLVPENVRLEIVSDNDLTVCRDFPAILVLRGNGSPGDSRDVDVGQDIENSQVTITRKAIERHRG